MGGFDPAIFLYNEDLDWCWRVREAGWAIALEPAVVVNHHGGASGRNPRSWRGRVGMAGMAYVVRKHRGWGYLTIFALARSAGFFLSWLLQGTAGVVILILGSVRVDMHDSLEKLERPVAGPLEAVPGSPWENGYNESFNAKLRDEFLNGEIFYTLPEAVVLVEQWRRLYNTVRLHSACGGRPPAPETIKPSPWFLKMPQLQGPPMAVGLT